MTREEAKNIIENRGIKGYCEPNRLEDAFDTAIKALEQEPRKGHWVKEETPFGWDERSYQCSECGRSIHLDTEVEDLEDYPYCHCGADMREVKE